MLGLIAAAGHGTRLQDLCEHRNKVLLDLGGATILDTILEHFADAGLEATYVTVGADALAVRASCGPRATCILNPFFDHAGILSSVWLARPFLDGKAFVFTTGDHWFARPRFTAFLAEQPTVDVLVDVDLKPCDDEDMKVYITRDGKLRTMTKQVQKGTVLGEFTGLVRCSAEGSSQFFEALEKYAWQHGVQGYVADVLCALHKKWELAFHLSADHRRVDVDFPYDLAKARELYRQQEAEMRKAGKQEPNLQQEAVREAS